VGSVALWEERPCGLREQAASVFGVEVWDELASSNTGRREQMRFLLHPEEGGIIFFESFCEVL
jgi:hypothetical protein